MISIILRKISLAVTGGERETLGPRLCSGEKGAKPRKMPAGVWGCGGDEQVSLEASRRVE